MTDNKKIFPDELWQAHAAFPVKSPDAFLRVPAPSFTVLHPGLLEFALLTLTEDYRSGAVSEARYAAALNYAVGLMEHRDHDTLARWLREARKDAWAVPALQKDVP
ncbi:hypothetical protein [Erwinia mallotivora]|uniref:hypothetical protein n=1 Tax=Erwinia mallotivora TaxID=69222 RepID=UPI0021C0D550|nr:hypothetical protein [Erwinia mallotivora]